MIFYQFNPEPKQELEVIKEDEEDEPKNQKSDEAYTFKERYYLVSGHQFFQFSVSR